MVDRLVCDTILVNCIFQEAIAAGLQMGGLKNKTKKIKRRQDTLHYLEQMICVLTARVPQNINIFQFIFDKFPSTPNHL